MVVLLYDSLISHGVEHISMYLFLPVHLILMHISICCFYFNAISICVWVHICMWACIHVRACVSQRWTLGGILWEPFLRDELSLILGHAGHTSLAVQQALGIFLSFPEVPGAS